MAPSRRSSCREGWKWACNWTGCFPGSAPDHSPTNQLPNIDSNDDPVQRFRLKEQQLPPLSLQDLNDLLDLLMAKVESHKESTSNVLPMQTLVPQYEKRKESLHLLIQSVPTKIKETVVGGSKDVLMPLLTKALEGAGNLQWVGTGLRLIAWTLDSIHATMQNSKDCFEVLQDAIDLMKKTKKIWMRACDNQEDTSDHDLQKIVEKAFRCAIICTSKMNNMTIIRFLDAQHVKNMMDDLKQELRDAKMDTLLYIAINKSGDGCTQDGQIIFSNVNNDEKVGGDERTSLCMEFLRKDSNDMIALCLHGMGGIGKSFMGLEIFKKFQASKSLPRRQESTYKTCRVELELGIEDKNLVGIQKQILEKLCGCDASNKIYDPMEGREMLSEELKKMSDPIFLYLDNVLKDDHLVEILPSASCFPKGSKLLVTSRGAGIENGVKRLGVVDFELIAIKKMEDREAKELLWKQIKNEEKRKVVSNTGSLEKVEKEVLALCGGLPLALKVVGGYIGSDEKGPTDVRVWQDVVKAMEKAEPLSGEAHDALYSRIKFSIESLDASVRSAFLDIVSFYDGYTPWKLMKRLVSRRRCMILQQRGLMQKKSTQKSFDGSSLIEIHDVILALTRRMISVDAHELRITGTDSFNKSGNLEKVVALKHVKLKAPMLSQMPLLRFMTDVEVEGEWPEEATRLHHLSVVHNLRSNTGKPFNLEKCACLKHMAGWQDQNASDLEMLRHPKISDTLEVLELKDWKQLKNIGVIETLRWLKELCLIGCSEISGLPQEIVSLEKLKRLSLRKFDRLQALPEGVESLISLKILKLESCPRLEELPKGIGSLICLTELSLKSCSAIKCLPEGISGLKSLTVLNLRDCRSLQCLPEGVQGLKNLTKLMMSDCHSLPLLPNGIAGMTSLTYLNLSGCKTLKSIEAETMSSLTCLTYLNLSGCKTLKSIEAVTMSSLTCLTELNLGNCESLQMLPKGFSRLTSLTHLHLAGGRSSLNSGLHEIESLTGLKSLSLPSCEGLYSLMAEGAFSLLGMVTEVEVSWSRCQLAGSLTSFTGLTNLSFEGHRGVDRLPEEITRLTGLTRLTITDCKDVQSLPPGFRSLRSLQRLKWEDCQSLQSLQEIAGFTGLQHLRLTGCASGEHSMLKELWTLTNVAHLDLKGWKNMRALPEGLASLTRLRWLKLSGWTSLLSLPDEITSLLSASLRVLWLKDCKSLTCLPRGFPNCSLPNFTLHLDGCTSAIAFVPSSKA